MAATADADEMVDAKGTMTMARSDGRGVATWVRRGLARARHALERGVWPFAGFIALLIAMAFAGLCGMPTAAAVLGVLALVVILGVLLAGRPPPAIASPAGEKGAPRQTGASGRLKRD